VRACDGRGAGRIDFDGGFKYGLSVTAKGSRRRGCTNSARLPATHISNHRQRLEGIMAGINKVIIVGNLGADPEIRYTPSGAAIAKFRVATSEDWKDKTTGEKKERTEWHRITVFGKLGEICGEYLSKGRQVYVEGRLQTSSYEDKEGVKRYSTDIIASDVQFLGSKEGGGGRANSGSGAPPRDTGRGPGPGPGDVDIPF
jgi:single-strand DNA-binding protein